MYTIRGHRTKAARAIQVALQLAPNNRFVVRAAARFYLHIKDLDRAHACFTSSSSLRGDPWLLSGEIAVASIKGRPSRHIKRAKRSLDQEQHSPFHASELCASLATLEAWSGRQRKARGYCEQALADPAENSVAQAAWLERNANVRLPRQFDADQSTEARAWAAARLGEWTTALESARNWQEEQPFSSRPALLGGNLALNLGDYEQAERIMVPSAVCNPSDFTLVNNLAFALALQDKADVAQQRLDSVDWASTTVNQQICLTATQGLVLYRGGQAEMGRTRYEEAIRLAQKARSPELEANAKVHLAAEEARIGRGPDVDGLIDEARGLAEAMPAPFSETRRAHLERCIALGRGDDAAT